MNSSNHRFSFFIGIGSLFLFLLAAIDLSCGDIGLKELIEGDMLKDILLGVRLPRLLTAIVAGASLALAGAQMQAIFRNPLADPHIMGISAGAGTGAAFATISAVLLPSMLNSMTIAIAAFIGATIPSIIMILVSSKVRDGNTLLLFGVMMGFIFSAITSLIEYMANEESLKIFYSWSAGSFTGNRLIEVAIMAFALAIASVMALANGKGLDLVLFGDEFSEISGASVKKIRVYAIISCCLLTGACTAFCGPIGFIGIIAPHIAKWIGGSSVYKYLIPSSMLIGSIIAVIADMMTHIGKTPLPAGSTVALIAIPVIFFILSKNTQGC